MKFDRIYGDEKKRRIEKFKTEYNDKINKLFESFFSELEDMNIGEGEIARLIQKLLNAKNAAMDAIN